MKVTVKYPISVGMIDYVVEYLLSKKIKPTRKKILDIITERYSECGNQFRFDLMNQLPIDNYGGINNNLIYSICCNLFPELEFELEE